MGGHTFTHQSTCQLRLYSSRLRDFALSCFVPLCATAIQQPSFPFQGHAGESQFMPESVIDSPKRKICGITKQTKTSCMCESVYQAQGRGAKMKTVKSDGRVHVLHSSGRRGLL